MDGRLKGLVPEPVVLRLSEFPAQLSFGVFFACYPGRETEDIFFVNVRHSGLYTNAIKFIDVLATIDVLTTQICTCAVLTTAINATMMPVNISSSISSCRT